MHIAHHLSTYERIRRMHIPHHISTCERIRNMHITHYLSTCVDLGSPPWPQGTLCLQCRRHMYDCATADKDNASKIHPVTVPGYPLARPTPTQPCQTFIRVPWTHLHVQPLRSHVRRHLSGSSKLHQHNSSFSKSTIGASMHSKHSFGLSLVPISHPQISQDVWLPSDGSTAVLRRSRCLVHPASLTMMGKAFSSRHPAFTGFRTAARSCFHHRISSDKHRARIGLHAKDKASTDLNEYLTVMPLKMGIPLTIDPHTV